MIVADGGVALASAVLAWLFWRGQLHTWQVYVIVLVRAAGNLFHWPAMQASTALMVPQRHLARVAGANQATRGAADVAAPPLGALLLAVMPIWGVMLLDVATALTAILPLCFIPVPQPERAAGPMPALGHDLREGLSYVWRQQGLRRICGLTMMLHFFIVPAFSLLPLLITQRFAGGVVEVAWGSSAWGAGLVAGGVLLSVWGGFRRRALTPLLGITGLGVGALGVGLVTTNGLPLALACLVLAGAMDSVTVGSAFAWLQTRVPADIQGRVLSTVVAATAAMMPLGMAVAGPFADRWGVRPWFLLAGGVQTLVGLAAWLVVALSKGEAAGELPAAGGRPADR